MCLDDAPGVKIGPTLGGHKMEHRNKESHLQNSSLLNWKAYSFDIWCLASPCGPLPSSFI